MFGFRRRRRAKIRARPFPEAWRAVLAKNVPYVAMLDDEERRRLFGDIQLFLAEKRFEGCGGLEIDDEIRVTIAAQACLLLLGREGDDFPGLDTLLVYPSVYRAASARPLPDGTVAESEEGRLGEFLRGGALVLAWDAVLAGAADPKDGRNVVLHEFAHQLDGENGVVDGAPKLATRAAYVAWARVLGAEYAALVEDVHAGRRPDLDPYGAVNPPEFFAVATEAFFEKPRVLARRNPELYERLREFYGQDPAARLDPRRP